MFQLVSWGAQDLLGLSVCAIENALSVLVEANIVRVLAEAAAAKIHSIVADEALAGSAQLRH
jgi:hypothetical protein